MVSTETSTDASKSIDDALRRQGKLKREPSLGEGGKITFVDVFQPTKGIRVGAPNPYPDPYAGGKSGFGAGSYAKIGYTPPSGTYDPTTLTYTAPTGEKSSMAQAPSGATITTPKSNIVAGGKTASGKTAIASGKTTTPQPAFKDTSRQHAVTSPRLYVNEKKSPQGQAEQKYQEYKELQNQLLQLGDKKAVKEDKEFIRDQLEGKDIDKLSSQELRYLGSLITLRKGMAEQEVRRAGELPYEIIETPVQKDVIETTQPSKIYTGSMFDSTLIPESETSYTSPLIQTQTLIDPAGSVDIAMKRQGIMRPNERYMSDPRVSAQSLVVQEKAKELQEVKKNPEAFTTEDGEPVTKEIIRSLEVNLDREITKFAQLQNRVYAEGQAERDFARSEADPLFGVPYAIGNIASTLSRGKGHELIGALALGRYQEDGRDRVKAVLEENIIDLYERPESANPLGGALVELGQSPVGEAIITTTLAGGLGGASGMLKTAGSVSKTSFTKTAVKYGLGLGLTGLYVKEKGEEIIKLHSVGETEKATGKTLGAILNLGLAYYSFKTAKEFTSPRPPEMLVDMSKVKGLETEPMPFDKGTLKSSGSQTGDVTVFYRTSQWMKKDVITSKAGFLKSEGYTVIDPITGKGIRYSTGTITIEGGKPLTFTSGTDFTLGQGDYVELPYKDSFFRIYRGDGEIFEGKSFADVFKADKNIASQYSEFIGGSKSYENLAQRVTYFDGGVMTTRPPISEVIHVDSISKSLGFDINKKAVIFGLGKGKSKIGILSSGGSKVVYETPFEVKAPKSDLIQALVSETKVVPSDPATLDKALGIALKPVTAVTKSVPVVVPDLSDAIASSFKPVKYDSSLLTGLVTDSYSEVGMAPEVASDVKKIIKTEVGMTQIPSYDTSIKNILKPTLETKRLMTSRNKEAIRLDNMISQDDDITNMLKPNQDIGLRTDMTTKTKLKPALTTPTTTTTTPTFVPTITPVTPTIIIPPFDFDQEPKQKLKSILGFDVFVKKRQEKIGKGRYRSRGFTKIGSGLARESALGLGGSIIDRTEARTFFIKPSKKPAREDENLKNIWKRISGQFRQPKNKKDRDVFVEKSLFAISSDIEKEEIPKKSARLRKQNVFGSNIMNKKKSIFNLRSVL